MDNNPKSKVGLGTSGLIIIVTAIVTVSASVLVEIFGRTYGDNSLAQSISDRVFYVSLSLLLVELIYEVNKIKKETIIIANAIRQNESVLFPPDESEQVEGYITRALQHKKADKMKIICYGTSKYGKIIDKLISDFPKIDAEIIVCSPEVTILDYYYDKELLRNVTEEVAKRPLTTVFVSDVPPTIRASLILAKDGSPLFCTIQSYLICPEEKSALFRGKNKIPSIVAQDKNSPILYNLKSSFEQEFKRLQKNSKKYCSNN